MIKGSTKGKNSIHILLSLVGEIFLVGEQTDGILEILPQFLGKAITGLGGGCSKMYVIEGNYLFKCLDF